MLKTQEELIEGKVAKLFDSHQAGKNQGDGRYSELSQIAAVKSSGALTSNYMCYTKDQIQDALHLRMMESNQNERGTMRALGG